MNRAIAWMTTNHVAANLLMLVLIIGGLLVGAQIKQEVFPEFELDMIQVGVPYPGASPAEVEQGVVLAVEEAVRGLDGVKRVTATAAEGAGGVTIELLLGTDPNKALQDVKNAVDRITSFPVEAERPVVQLLSNRQGVLSLAIYGDQTEEVLRQVAERVREELLLDPEITYVELNGVRAREISIEVSQEDLRRYGLTLDDIAQKVGRTAVELPGGGIKTGSGEVLLRVAERRNLGREFEDITLVSDADGAEVRLGDVARIVDGFADTDQYAAFNGKRAVMVDVYRTGDQTPIEVSDAAHEYIERAKGSLPPGISLASLDDRSDMYRDRVDLLMRNAAFGLVLVLVVLSLFLEIRLAFWVTMGIPISFLGSMLIMPLMGVSINMISLFAFLICLGIVVDDAIVVGENVFERRQRGVPLLTAAVEGAQRIATPVTFSVLTTVVAFLPMFFVPGFMGKIFRVIPAIVVSVLLISLIESLVVLPAHLAHRSKFLARIFGEGRGKLEAREESRLISLLNAPNRLFGSYLKVFIANRYAPLLKQALSNRYLTMAIGIAIFVMTVAYVFSGRMPFTFMPKVEADQVTAYATLPFGVPVDETKAVERRLLSAAREVIAESGGDDVVRGVYTQIGSVYSRRMSRGPSGGGGSHLGNVVVFLVPSDKRDVTAAEFAQRWREKTKDLVGLESLTFKYSTGPGAGAAVEIQLEHRDMAVLERASADLAETLSTFEGIKDVDDGFAAGKPQLDFKVKPEGRSLGLTPMEIGRQVRAAFYGSEAIRQQRGRDEIRVMVRLPEEQRRRERSLEQLLIFTPAGGEIPLHEVASIQRGHSYIQIRRADGRRVVTVTADVEAGKANAQKILRSLEKDGVMEDLRARYPGLGYSFEGDSRRRTESLDSLKVGYVFAMIVLFALLAVPFRSYLQPMVVMSAIPFGFVGAVGGHFLMGFDLSLISIMGIIAVSGIVVNDSLVLVHAANAAREGGATPSEAIFWAGQRRFRPIMLTSLTTFFGLAPMILEPSVQARFLIPMAISLGFGVLFATFITLLLVPCLYLIAEDARAFVLGPREEREAPEGVTWADV